MKTFPLKNEEGELYAFAIENNFISSSSIARFIKNVPGCTIKWVRKMFSKSEIHVKFEYEGVLFSVWEPFGDNSHLHIGPENEEINSATNSLESCLKNTKTFSF